MNKRLIIIIGVLLIAIPLFLLKSSNINYKEDYPELKVSSSNSLVINDTVYSFFSKFKKSNDIHFKIFKFEFENF